MSFSEFLVKIQEKLFSPGRIKKTEIDSYYQEISSFTKSINKNEAKEIDLIAHGAGSWRYYPMGINKKGKVYGNGFRFKKNAAKNINDLIDATLAINKEVSFEMDIQYPPEKHPIRKEFPEDHGFIIHDIPNWKKLHIRSKTLDFFKKNTVKKVLKHFTKNNYHQTSKLFFEIKVTEKCYGIKRATCEIVCEDLAKGLIPFAEKYKRDSGENWMQIVSFSPRALRLFREHLPDNLKDKFNYCLIVGFTGGYIKSKLAQIKGFVPAFDETIKSKILEMDWLDCLWFSIQGITDFKEQFEALNNRRIAENMKELEFSFSTYQYKKEKLKKMLKSQAKYPFNFQSFLIDIDDK
ncbi:hypothetical protein [Aureivirga sp. CE67]|uniref:hypothetical protein n=1 Tax=Aureivirga sp. CE67 TaxID=1788983 RepID=UPI0018C978E0|nr:hypothetical protein [Aureivirga sp. CE67]